MTSFYDASMREQFSFVNQMIHTNSPETCKKRDKCACLCVRGCVASPPPLTAACLLCCTGHCAGVVFSFLPAPPDARATSLHTTSDENNDDDDSDLQSQTQSAAVTEYLDNIDILTRTLSC